MKILWLTGRSFTDLCSTTQIEIANGLCEKGHSVSIVNGDGKTMTDVKWEHYALGIKARKGTNTRRLGLACAHHLHSTSPNSVDVVIVEWRLLPYVFNELKKKNLPWSLMDRSPPAYRGLLAKLQWLGWKKAWRIARKNNSPCFVVSSAHAELVNARIGKKKCVIVPAGVNLERFKPRTRRTTLTMVYHGRLDKNRGVLALPMLARKARNRGIEVDLILIGKGDAWGALKTIAENQTFIDVRENIPNLQLAEVLSECHLGLLPMPDQRIWRLASPLKRSEYLASGLVVLGIDHSGHQLMDSKAPFMQLFDQSEFHSKGCLLLENMIEEGELLSLQARSYAKNNLSWEISVDIVEDTLLKLALN